MANTSKLERRRFLSACGGAALGNVALGSWGLTRQQRSERLSCGPTHSVIPVVGDGRWIWREPPREGRGYLESRPYKVSIGIELEGIGNAADIISTTTAPVEWPEQKIESVTYDTVGCEVQLRQLTSGAGQLVLTAPSIARGQKIVGTAHFTMQLLKQFFAYERDQFPARQEVPGDIRSAFLQDSPGIQTGSKQVKQLADELSAETDKHPWAQAERFFTWVREKIRPQLGAYTSVTTALDSRRGDCEEMAGVFVALCRAVQIPARLVWVPNHAWAEFYLADHAGRGHWLPAHTACYPWFGYTGAHELVLQKGDRIYIPERRRTVRLMDDWLQAAGRLPKPRYTGEVSPQPAEKETEAGPGARRKDERGNWQPIGTHALDKYTRR